MKDTSVLALTFIKRRVDLHFGPHFYGYALNCNFVYLTIPRTRPLSMMKQNKFVLFIYATAKSEIHICSNKHETALVFKKNRRSGF